MFDSIDYIHTTDDNLNPDNTYDPSKLNGWNDWNMKYYFMICNTKCQNVRYKMIWNNVNFIIHKLRQFNAYEMSLMIRSRKMVIVVCS